MTAEISAVVAVIAALISCIQVWVSSASSRGQILRDAMKDHWSQENLDDRDVVYGLQGKPYGKWSADERDAAARVAIRISQLGFLMRNSYADRKSFLDFWAPWCVRLFIILSPLIADQRVSKNAPDQWIYFEWLARKAALYTARKSWWEKRSWEALKWRTKSLPDPSQTGVSAKNLHHHRFEVSSPVNSITVVRWLRTTSGRRPFNLSAARDAASCPAEP